MHAACLLAFAVGVSWAAVITCAALYWIRMFGITAGFHRYFAHASFKTSRGFQFVLALLGSMSLQKGVLWWASLHRHHHANSDEEDDIHSPVRHGFWWSHMIWFLCVKNDATRWNLIQNLARYRELVWLNDHHHFTGLGLGGLVYLFGWWAEVAQPGWQTTRWQMLVWGWLISTVALYHGTFSINSLAHVFGSRRYFTRDGSRNNLLLALITLGEGWHNNHHYAPSSVRMGFFWWEIDQSYYVLKALSWLGVVWDLQPPPRRVYAPAATSRPADEVPYG
ncbi:MAG: acyl-CoA desaturase [Acidobacteria bacterium]|nr:acyl-CoA desaturase [Acidobacteriota bacterium]